VKLAALVPVRSFARAKRRLRARFSDREVEAIGRALLDDVLVALLAVPLLERVAVLTGDREVADAARAAGGQVHWLEPDPGLNAALDSAARQLRTEGCSGLLVALGDLALLRAGDVAAVLEVALHHPVVGVASLDGGTALLFQSPPGLLPARYGPESFEAHCAAARQQGIELVALDLPDGLARCDLDTPDDAARIAASGRAGRTAELLRKLGA